jgi:hypothetical protein
VQTVTETCSNNMETSCLLVALTAEEATCEECDCRGSNLSGTFLKWEFGGIRHSVKRYCGV